MGPAALTMTATLPLDDIQGLVARGYRDLRAARFLLFGITDGGAARAWLARLTPDVTTSAANPTELAVNVALTASGLDRLGVPAEALRQFSAEFTGGMTTDYRSRLLGDVDGTAPERWAWGGPTTPQVDVMLMLYATDEARLDALVAVQGGAAADHGLTPVVALETSDLGDVEHFGFRDGISQPTVQGLSSKSDAPANTVAAGEFILGHPNEYGLYTPRPLVNPADDAARVLPRDPDGSGGADLGANGTYLVFRQLEQDVRAFWQFLDGFVRSHDAAADASSRARLAAKLVGRWASGAPLMLSPEHDDPELGQANDFAYFHDDPDGERCPIGAHVRRSHPRDSLDPDPGSARSVAVSKRHRILRRGREYGQPLPMDAALRAGDVADTAERGLHFVCLNANLARQYEFIQHTWVNNPSFRGLYDEPDPVVSPSSGASYRIPAKPVRARVTGVPRFVTVRGGAYFFLPGLRAIRYLGSLTGPGR